MNFFAHAVIASRRDASAAEVLGAMLPDLWSMARLRPDAIDDPDVAAGVALHHRTDDVFHRAPTFLALQAENRAALEEAGVPHYSALAAAHVGVELVLDGWLFDQLGALAAYDAALTLEAPAIRWRGEATHDRWRAFLRRLRGADLPARYRDPIFVGERLVAILSPRRRLAVDEAGAAAILAWAPTAAPAIEARAAELYAETLRGLGEA
ncbi:MAG: hypothetical protein R3A79_29280 [Nannocystaceae bacterium]